MDAVPSESVVTAGSRFPGERAADLAAPAAAAELRTKARQAPSLISKSVTSSSTIPRIKAAAPSHVAKAGWGKEVVTWVQ
jgi:hypothetical protein